MQKILFLQKSSKKPLDLILRDYFQTHKCLGSKDRKFIGNTLYEITRWKSLIDHVGPEDILSYFQTSFDQKKLLQDTSIPDFAKAGLSPFLFHKFSEHYGQELAKSLGSILNEEAPTTVRANPLKTSQSQLIEIFQEKGFNVTACTKALYGITFSKREALMALEEFKQGLFEIQDEGSQLIADLVDAKSGDCILDFCSGSGGKSLGFAHKMQGKGQIYLHDVREHVLKEAKLRFRRSGIQNAQFLPSNHPQLKKLFGKCDTILLDVPCTGTGTLRRNPHHKWEIDETMLQGLVSLQRSIMHDAIKYLKPTGRLIYATCSILPEENEQQAEYLEKHFGLRLESQPLKLLPTSGKWDGFFSAVFRK